MMHCSYYCDGKNREKAFAFVIEQELLHHWRSLLTIATAAVATPLLAEDRRSCRAC